MRFTARLVVVATVLGIITTAAAGTAIAQPANDGIRGATDIVALPFSDTVLTTDTAAAAEVPSDCGIGHTVWYRFTASADGFVRADSLGSNFDTVIAVYLVAGAGPSEIACNDDSVDLQSVLVVPVAAGETYLFQAGGCCSSRGDSGELTFNLAESGPPFALERVTISGGSVDPVTGIATIKGAVVCSGPAERVFIRVRVRERVGRLIIRGSGSRVKVCDGRTPYRVAVEGGNGLYVPGNALVSVGVSSEDTFILREATIRLQRG